MGPHTPRSRGQEISTAATAAEGWLETLRSTLLTLQAPDAQKTQD